MDKVEIFENQRAAKYNDFIQVWVPNYHYFLSKVPQLLSEVKNQNLLVAGCGTGNEIAQFVKASSNWEITGVDPSPEMIKQASERLKFSNVNLIEGLVSDLDVSKKFGAATLLLVLHFMEDDGTKLSLLKNIAERLESNAPFVMLDITGSKQQIQENLKILERLLPDDLDKEDVKNRVYRIENKLYPISEDRLSELMVKAGFETPTRFFQTSIYMGWITRKR